MSEDASEVQRREYEELKREVAALRALVNARQDRYRLEYPLHAAIERGDLKEVKALLALDAAVDLKDSNGYTPLMKALSHPECLKVLVEAGARLDGAPPNAVLTKAVAKGQADLVEYIVEHGAQPDLFAQAFRGRCEDLRKCAKGDPALHASYEGASLLHWAVFWGKAEVCRVLIEKGCDVNKRATFQSFAQATPLAIASEGPHALIPVLLEHGADPNIPYSWDTGWRPVPVIFPLQRVQQDGIRILAWLHRRAGALSEKEKAEAEARLAENETYVRALKEKGARNEVPFEERQALEKEFQSKTVEFISPPW
ncbi:MAG: ankyrin repeat domain-containing protein [Planctomycetota bacterium]|nr:ankyrin repeat domain-containing protein [Planctomycetota bacterium]